MNPESILVAGATGLVGRELVRQLAADRGSKALRVLVRGSWDGPGRALKLNALDADPLEALVEPLEGVLCCLGTTLRRAGSREAFEAVDLHLVTALATRAEALGARHFSVVSSVGADPASSNFYLRTKGLMEQAVAATTLPCCCFIRPSLLLGQRDEFRLGERLAEWPLRGLAPLLAGPLTRYRPVSAETVAAAMIRSLDYPPGRHGIEGKDLHRAG